jgi:hypothetical protein
MARLCRCRPQAPIGLASATGVIGPARRPGVVWAVICAGRRVCRYRAIGVAGGRAVEFGAAMTAGEDFTTITGLGDLKGRRPLHVVRQQNPAAGVHVG